jgi:hypothetical protein
MVAFDKSPLKLFTLRFLNISVQAPSCERPKTTGTQRNLFLSFENNNFFSNNGIASEAYEKIHETCMPRGRFKHRPNDSLPTLQMSGRIIAFFEKIYDGEPILTVFSNIGEDVPYRFSIKCMM